MGLLDAMKAVQEKDEAKMGETVSSRLAPKDGNIHAIMFHTCGDPKIFVQTAMRSLDSSFTNQLEGVLSEIQAAGREVVDVKFQVMVMATAAKQDRYDVMVMYK